MKQTFFILFYLFQTDDVTFMFRKRIDFLDIFIKNQFASCHFTPLAQFFTRFFRRILSAKRLIL
jgi:hypothetical protein